MALTPRLELRQSQSLVMTPQLMQAIKLLQLSHVDLALYVDAELEKNPLLQRADEFELASETGASEAIEGVNAATPEADWLDHSLGANPQKIAETFDTDAENVFPDDAGSAGVEVTQITGRDTQSLRSAAHSSSSEDYDLEAFVSEKVSLTDHLMKQVGLAMTDPARLLIARTLVDSVDAAGYLRVDLQEFAESLGAPLDLVEDTLSILQTFDPPGICARNLSECLALQLKEKNRHDPAIAALLDNLDLLARRDFAGLRAVCGVDHDDLMEMISEIRMLDPKPGEAFDNTLSETLIPDVIVRASPDGSWAIELNPETLPRVIVDHSYYATVARTASNEFEKTYLTDCLQTANWLTKSLDQRAKTILKVAAEIVRQQDAFLTKGIAYLRPLNLKTVADAIEMHESTVSRVTSNKYIVTPRGIFELKYFFTASIASSEGGDAHSAEAVRHRIRTLIDAENPNKILSDDALVTLLNGEGIDIARRTVAKYRESLRIASSVQRRREKSAVNNNR
ncbi:MAG: RNA polymerase factor sigma-54 [Rhizobiales bacterium]|nr:RNA polymerase factor sigma-54 [Hyphomicrobiales bacterium]